MTREEHDDLVSKTLHTFDRNYVHKSYIASLEQRNTELEQRVKELEEPKGCKLCRYWTDSSLQCCTYHEIDTTNIYHYCDGCVDYEPKENK